MAYLHSLQEDGSGTPSALPLAAEEWADELLSRVFAVLTNLDPPVEHRGADAGSGSPLRGNSFLMASEQSMFRRGSLAEGELATLIKSRVRISCILVMVRSPSHFWGFEFKAACFEQICSSWLFAFSRAPLTSYLKSRNLDTCRPTMHLLFARMAPGMRKRAMMRLARFATGSTLPSTLTEVLYT